MTTSQEFIPVSDVKSDLVFLKDGGVGIILSVSAVNFALLFETEQISIIDSFAGMLNSLSFPIQIVIYSKIMDVSSYLHTIDNALAKQSNPLLKKMTLGYRGFVEKSIKDNNVLDKKFYIAIKITSLELGLLPSNEAEKTRKVTTMLEPRRDHLIRQLDRLGLKAKQLTSEEIIKFFYEIYNPPITGPIALPPLSNIKPEPLLQVSKPETVIAPVPTAAPMVPNNLPPKLRPLKTTLAQPAVTTPSPPLQPGTLPPRQATIPPAPAQPQPNISPVSTTPVAQTSNFPPSTQQLSSPFVVEELPDEDGS